MMSPPHSLLVRLLGTQRMARLLVERLAIPDATPHELRPLRHYRNRIGLFGQQPPQCWMMPAQLVQRAVAVLADTLTQLPDLFDQLLTGHLFQVIVHAGPPAAKD